MHVEVVIKICLDEIVYKASDGWTFVIYDVSFGILGVLFPHEGRTEFCLCLSFEVWLLNLDADCSDDTLTDILWIIILLEELFKSW